MCVGISPCFRTRRTLAYTQWIAVGAWRTPPVDEFDYVIAGAGPAGCVLANRLSADGKATVCILEAGGSDRHPFIKIPAGFVKTLYGDRFVWPFVSEPAASLDGRTVALPQGRVLGGSSSINGMVYNRGQRADFDTWAQMGNRGWGFDDLTALFQTL